MENEASRFVVARVERRGELPTTYLRKFALVGRNGLQQLAFGPATTAAHLLERRDEADDGERRLHRRVSEAEYNFGPRRRRRALSCPLMWIKERRWALNKINREALVRRIRQ